MRNLISSGLRLKPDFPAGYLFIVSLTLLCVSAIPAMAAPPPTPPAAGAENQGLNDARVLLLCIIAGAFGGILYSVKEKNRLHLPGRRDSGTYHLGFIADVLFGIAGGIVIFLLYPDDIALFNKGISGIIKFLGLGIVGGYGGRLFLEKAMSARISGLEEKMNSMDAREKIDANAKAMVDRYLDEDPQGNLKDEELTRLLKNSSYSIQVDTFMRARSFRQKMDRVLRDARDAGDERKMITARRGLQQSIKVLNALDEIDEDRKYHRTHGQLAYAHRALEDYGKAIESFKQGIAIRDKFEVRGYKVYEFGLAACLAKHSPDDLGSIQDNLAKAVEGKGEARDRLEPLEERYEIELIQWFKEHPAELKAFTEKHGFNPLVRG